MGKAFQTTQTPDFPDSGTSIAVDTNGNVYTTGIFYQTVDFDPGIGMHSLTSAGGADIFVSKLDHTGNFIWAKNVGGTGHEGGNSINIDALGNVYMTGFFQGTADFNPGQGVYNITSAGGEDIFISKLDPSGSFLWAKSIGGTSADYGHSLSIDQEGNVYTTGYFVGAADFDPGMGTYFLTSSSQGFSDVFIAKLNPSGNFVWAKRVGSASSSDLGNSLALDTVGNIYTTGSFEGTADFDRGTGISNLTSAGSTDVFILKLDPSGNFDWAKNVGGSSSDIGETLKVDGQGNILVAGRFIGAADFDPGPGNYNLTSVGSSPDIFILKLSQTSALPLTLIEFSAIQISKNEVKLQWKTAAEQNVSKFLIERHRPNENEFTSIAVVTASNTVLSKTYSFDDTKAIEGRSFYRLKIVDIDGTISFSKVIAVNWNEVRKPLVIFPNPVKNALNIQAFGKDETGELHITDATGKTVKKQKIQLHGFTSLTLDIQELKPGKYYLVVQRANKQDVLEFMKID